jgi:hypothetical protein
MNPDIDKLQDIVNQLHNVAKTLTEELGLSTLTLNVRECADRLNEIIKTQQ